MINVTRLGPFPPAPVPPPPPQTLDEALNRLAFGDRGVIDAAAHLAFIREQIAAAVVKEQQKRIEQMNAVYSAHELGALADELDEENFATAAQKLRAAIATITRLQTAVAEAQAKGAAVALLRDLEWSGKNRSCPACSNEKLDGHAADCKLASLLG